MNKKSIFLDAGYKDFQLLYIIPIICSYADNKGIKEILFENSIPSQVLKDKNISQLLKFKKITILKKNNLFYKIIKFINFFLSFQKVIVYFILFNFKLVNKNNDWYKYQLMHAFWDIAYVNSKDYEIVPTYFNRIKSVIQIIAAENFSKKIFKKIDTAFLSHQVYAARVLLANFRRQQIRVYAHSNCNIHQVDKAIDNSSNFIEKSTLNKVEAILSKKKIINYWINVKNGHSANQETRSISKINNLDFLHLDNALNVIFLHVFRDSPYNYIDKTRIFFSYYDWFEETLKIIKNSKEKWVIRTHPFMYQWGENSKLIVDNFIKKIFNNKLPQNIRIEDKSMSNLLLLKKVKRVVTYSGNVHIEAACLGKKPICISETTLGKIDKKFIIKPHNIQQYRKLLLINSDNKIFNLSKDYTDKAISILFIKDKVISFSDILKTNNIYRKSSQKKKKIEFIKNKMKVKKYLHYFKTLGRLHALGLKQSVTKSYLKTIND
jgi:hypothetical protein